LDPSDYLLIGVLVAIPIVLWAKLEFDAWRRRRRLRRTETIDFIELARRRPR
jgi:hypothetical protein